MDGFIFGNEDKADQTQAQLLGFKSCGCPMPFMRPWAL